MRIGGRRIRDISSVGSIILLPSLPIRSLADPTIGMVFFADKPIAVNKPTWKSTSLFSPLNDADGNAPGIPKNDQGYREREIPSFIARRRLASGEPFLRRHSSPVIASSVRQPASIRSIVSPVLFTRRDVTNEESGAISPLALRAYILLILSGSVRKYAPAAPDAAGQLITRLG